MSEVWVTGFEPFGNMPSNPSAQIVQQLRERRVPRLHTAVLPVDGSRIQAALQAIWQQQPAALIHLGLAEDRKAYCSERWARNVLRYPRPDNAGAVEEGVVEAGGPKRLAARLDHEGILNAWTARGLPAQLSESAGSFLCNQSLYLSLSALREVPVGFIHLPPTPQLSAERGRPLEEQVLAVGLVIEQVFQSVPEQASAGSNLLG